MPDNLLDKLNKVKECVKHKHYQKECADCDNQCDEVERILMEEYPEDKNV